MELTYRVKKTYLRKILGYNNRKSFIDDLKILITDKDCPFNYNDVKNGHYIKSHFANYIINNLN